MSDPHDLQRFVDAQDRVYHQVLLELGRGQKTSHWMWFVFPQMAGLGGSEMARRYALSSLHEAKAYLEHPLLGPRLRECTALVVSIDNRSIGEILGFPDDLKFRSSMTLFAKAAADPQVFIDALGKFFEGRFDQRTLDLI